MNKDCKLTVKGIELLFALLLVLTISHSADAQNYDAYENITEVFENWTWTHYGVNLSIKFCDAFDCVDNPAFTEYEDISDYSNYHGQYFQYRALLFTDNASRSPRLRNVTVEATTSPTTYKTVYDVFQSFSFLGNREREIKLQVRSCRLSDCSDNSEFIGQDGTPGSYFEFPQANPDHEANFNNLSKVPIASNRYFQYKAYLTTDDTSKTPKLWNVTVNSTAVTNGSNKSLTVKLWLYRESGSITQEPILCRWDSVSDVNRTYCLLLDSNGKARFYLSSDGVSSGVVISSSTIPAGQWTSIAATYDDSTDQLKIYINAIREDNITWIHGISENNSRILIGGGDFGEFRRYLNGDIDEVRIYNRSLSAEEIRLSYGSSLQQVNSTHWEFYGNVTGLDEAVYQYQGWANDTAGNDGTTGVRTLTIDTTNPTIIWTRPRNDNLSILGGWFIQNITVTDNIELWWLNCTIYNSTGTDMWNCSRNLTLEGTSFNLFNRTDISGWPYGTYTENCTCWDMAKKKT